MLVWGKGGNTVEAVHDAGIAPCPVCKGNQPTRLMLNYRYAHVWYLFSWVTSRQYVCQCTRCNQGYVVEPRAIADKVGRTDPIPFMRRRGWLVGLVLAGVLASAGGVAAHLDQQDVKAYVEAPLVGDIYRADLSKISRGFARSPAYGLMRIESINNEHVTFRIAGTAYTRRSGADKDISRYAYRNTGYFSDELVRLPRQQVRQLYEQSVIYDVDRKGTGSTTP